MNVFNENLTQTVPSEHINQMPVDVYMYMSVLALIRTTIPLIISS